MEIKITLKQILIVLQILSWIIFIGLCIEAGGFITNAVFAIANPEMIPRLWRQIDLSALFKYDHGHFFVVTAIIGITLVLKAWMFYLIIKILQSKDLDVATPFRKKVRRFVASLSYIALLIGLFSWNCIKYIKGLADQGVSLPEELYLRLGGADVWLFMAVILFVIAQIFKKGIEIQSENDLTI